MRVVVDTNIFVSSFFGGNPQKIIDLWKKGEISLCLPKDVLDEYVNVLQRIGLGDEKEIEELFRFLPKASTLFLQPRRRR